MIIKTENLTRIYSSGVTAVRALKNVTLNVDRGEFVAIAGTSGSWKSTLLHLLGGLDLPTEGKVFIDGNDLYAMKPDPLTVFRRRFIGFVFQSYNLIPTLSVWENVVLPLGLDGIKADKSEIETLLSVLGIIDKRNSLPSQLSGGQQQRVAIARALATKPHIVLADEPTGNLDSKTGLEVMLTLGKLNEDYAQTIVMITHNEELAQLAGRRIRIEDGQIVDGSGGAQ
ncbi:MAG: ABC transporter ATP-binding protein [Eubacteriales bacterium]|nr:ABC transporter ATP-binding protein [Eubacteriales bacterium]